MTRFIRTVAVVAVICAFTAFPAAATPSVSKQILTTQDGNAVVVFSVSASSRSIYGVALEDASASVEDVVAPEGWAAVAGEDRVVFRTVDSPIAPGASATFRIVTKNVGATYGVTFRDAKSSFGPKTSI